MAGNTSRPDTIDMVKHYQRHHKLQIEKPGHDPDVKSSNCGWFDLKQVMDFLTYISGDGRKADGLRIYFGGRTKDGADKGQMTVILVGTKKEGEKNMDLDPKGFDKVDTYAFRADDPDFDNSHLNPPGDGGETILAEAQKP
jgi:hypothetical protein